MDIQLEPLSLGQILDRIAQLYRSRFLLFAGIVSVPIAVLVALGLVGVVAGVTLHLGGATSTAAMIVAGGAVLVAVLAYLVLIGLSLAATCCAVADLYLGRPTSIARAYLEVRPHWFRYIRLMFVATLYAWAPAILIVAVATGAAVAVHLLNPQIETREVAALIVILVALATVPLSIWMGLRYSLCVAASLFEGLGVRASLRRSVFLTKRGRWRIFVLFLLAGVLAGVVGALVQWPVLIASTLLASRSPAASVVLLVLSQLGSVVVNILLGPVYGIGLTLFYYDERIRKEGFDIEWMMQRANLTAPGPPGAFAEGAG